MKDNFLYFALLASRGPHQTKLNRKCPCGDNNNLNDFDLTGDPGVQTPHARLWTDRGQKVSEAAKKGWELLL